MQHAFNRRTGRFLVAGLLAMLLGTGAMAADRAKATEVGCDGYLAKPVEPRRVIEEVKKFVGEANGGASGEATA